LRAGQHQNANRASRSKLRGNTLTPNTKMPIKTPPFYVMEASPIVNNTQGGPEHDVEQRVLDPMKKPIPRLYVAGEISSIYGHLYLEAGNITECFVAGKIAGKNAA
jgi:succinate dehydrogenase/fumarate reductase flavoprotein subunit